MEENRALHKTNVALYETQVAFYELRATDQAATIANLRAENAILKSKYEAVHAMRPLFEDAMYKIGADMPKPSGNITDIYRSIRLKFVEDNAGPNLKSMHGHF